ncbi:hypothetical protein [Alicyclobacillus sp. ALC3]|uniref:hypothetical protein n=1 Tax=Alicyclobacillus sp. ALC3 TaxID=2796143 RepID=UPI002378D63A|nr:hypothetical protein [Alicyclobacillus sp. ALC3]WDL99721.1 hypothetical protein JC200_24120 [Alicyclobacillus sp. ALC3]
MSNEIARAKLEAFYRAGVGLSNHWHEGLNEGYPLEASFDEWLQNTMKPWVEAALFGRPLRVGVLIYRGRHGDTEFATVIAQDNHMQKAWFSRPESQVRPTDLSVVQYVEWGTHTQNLTNIGGYFKFDVTRADLMDRIRADWHEQSRLRVAR